MGLLNMQILWGLDEQPPKETTACCVCDDQIDVLRAKGCLDCGAVSCYRHWLDLGDKCPVCGAKDQ